MSVPNFHKKNIISFQFTKTLTMLIVLSGLTMACAVRLEPAYVTGLIFAKQPVPPTIVATPLLPQATPVLEISTSTRTTELEILESPERLLVCFR